jgi:hypothetical protein
MILASILDNRIELPIVWGNLQNSMSPITRGKKILSKAWDGFMCVVGQRPQHVVIFES